MGSRALQFKVGLLIIISLVVLGGFIFILGNYSLGKGYYIYVDFDFAGNLSPGAPVKISGIKMGRVESIRFMGGEFDTKVNRRVFVRIKLWINEKARNAVRSDSRVFINTQGILGEQYVEIEPGNMDSPQSSVLSGESLAIKGESPPRTDLVIGKLYTFLDQVTNILSSEQQNIRLAIQRTTKTLGNVNDILEKNKTEINSMVAKSSNVLTEVEKSLSTVNSSIGDGKKIVHIIRSTDYMLNVLSSRLPSVMTKIDTTLTDVSTMTKIINVNDKEKIFQSLDRINNLSSEAITLTREGTKLARSVSSGNGTVGALMTKREVYEDLKELVRDLRENPWKLFWKD
ncbi:MCE family protein [Myxococcota bacterium]|nr:MCE family protein [Myxococcota bacterium]MBU1381620.1 MCE family protein [Myxococcota bacterium]MBU1496836.1 MCE family protein [Myxococcota bacterium]